MSIGEGKFFDKDLHRRCLGPLSSALRAALRAVALSHARLRAGVTRGLSRREP